MMQGAERIFVQGHDSPIGAALVRQLVRLGHPRSHILFRSATEPAWVDEHSVRASLASMRPDWVYVVDSPISDGTGGAPCLVPTSLVIEAAALLGVERLMYVGNEASHPHNEHPADATAHQRCADALQRCEVLSARGLDFRSVLTCDPYGPYWPGSVPAVTTPVAVFIGSLLVQLDEALASKRDRVVIQATPDAPLELMFLSDIAEAVVHAMELPRAVLAAVAQVPSLHLDIGAEGNLRFADLVKAAAKAAGFQGLTLFETRGPGPTRPRLDSQKMAILGWRPLIQLDTGMELAIMDFRLRNMARQAASLTAYNSSRHLRSPDRDCQRD